MYYKYIKICGKCIITSRNITTLSQGTVYCLYIENIYLIILKEKIDYINPSRKVTNLRDLYMMICEHLFLAIYHILWVRKKF